MVPERFEKPPFVFVQIAGSDFDLQKDDLLAIQDQVISRESSADVNDSLRRGNEKSGSTGTSVSICFSTNRPSL